MKNSQFDVLAGFGSSVVSEILKSEDSRHILAFKSRENGGKIEKEAAVDPVESSQVL